MYDIADATDCYNEIEMHEIDDLWCLSEDFSVTDAAALIAGYNPVMVQCCRNDTNFDRVFSRYPVVMEGLCKAVSNGRIKANIRYSAREFGYVDHLADIDSAESESWIVEHGTTKAEDEILADDHSCFFKSFPDWNLTTVSRDDLVVWLASRGIRTGFFFPDAKSSDAPDYLDPNHSRYSHKLAASVKVWLAMEDENLRRGKGTVAAMEQWLESRYKELGLVHEKDNKNNGTRAGDMNNSAISEAAKVANWQYGGSPKTPGE